MNGLYQEKKGVGAMLKKFILKRCVPFPSVGGNQNILV